VVEESCIRLMRPFRYGPKLMANNNDIQQISQTPTNVNSIRECQSKSHPLLFVLTSETSLQPIQNACFHPFPLLIFRIVVLKRNLLCLDAELYPVNNEKDDTGVGHPPAMAQQRQTTAATKAMGFFLL